MFSFSATRASCLCNYPVKLAVTKRVETHIRSSWSMGDKSVLLFPWFYLLPHTSLSTNSTAHIFGALLSKANFPPSLLASLARLQVEECEWVLQVCHYRSRMHLRFLPKTKN